MDFFSMDFSELFLNKYGIEVFENFSNKIKEEKGYECSDDYIKSVFKVAFLAFFGFDEDQSQKLLDDIVKNNNINVKVIMTNQRKSVNSIKEFLEYNKNKNMIE